MLMPEDFTNIADRASSEGVVTNDEVTELVNTVRRLDALTFIFQQAIELTTSNVNSIMNELAVRLFADAKDVDPALAEKATGHIADLHDQLMSAVEGYITTAIITAADTMGLTPEALVGITPDEQAE